MRMARIRVKKQPPARHLPLRRRFLKYHSYIYIYRLAAHMYITINRLFYLIMMKKKVRKKKGSTTNGLWLNSYPLSHNRLSLCSLNWNFIKLQSTLIIISDIIRIDGSYPYLLPQSQITPLSPVVEKTRTRPKSTSLSTTVPQSVISSSL
jgi:hypothetical protein